MIFVFEPSVALSQRLFITQISPKPPSPLVFPSPRTGEGKGFEAPLLLFWEKGLGDEGKQYLVGISETFA